MLELMKTCGTKSMNDSAYYYTLIMQQQQYLESPWGLCFLLKYVVSYVNLMTRNLELTTFVHLR